jgi:hypothetical protein
VKLNIDVNERRDLLCLALFYLAAHLPLLLLSNAIYWDDWFLHAGNPDFIIRLFREQAATLFYLEGPLHLFLLHNFGPWIYKWLTLILMGASGFFLYLVLRRWPEVNREIRFFIVLFFLIAPFNIARVAIIDFRYTVCYFLFFFAWYLYSKNKVFSLICFFICFNTQSLLVFFAIPVIEIYLLKYKNLNWRNILNFSVQNISLILLAPAYFLIKIYFFQPTGEYSGYNLSYSFSNIFITPALQFANFLSLSISMPVILLVIICSVLSHKSVKYSIADFSIRMNLVDAKVTIFFGLIACILACFPYWVLGLTPTFNEWSSRHQLLLPFGFSLLAIGCLAIVRKFFIRRQLLIFMLGSCIAFNISNYTDLFIDWKKQQAIISLLSKDRLMLDKSLIFFEDKTLDLNALNRSYRPYEWSGLMAVAFGNNCRQGYSLASKPDVASINFKPLLSNDFCENFVEFDSPINVQIEKKIPGRIKTLFNLLFKPEDAFILKYSFY